MAMRSSISPKDDDTSLTLSKYDSSLMSFWIHSTAFASKFGWEIRDGHAISIHRPSETKRIPGGVGGGLQVISCIRRAISSSLNLQRIDEKNLIYRHQNRNVSEN